MAVKHTQQHSPCLQTGGRAPAIFYRSVSWQLITLKSQNRRQILPIKLRHLQPPEAQMVTRER